jgi:hypothetical protein
MNSYVSIVAVVLFIIYACRSSMIQMKSFASTRVIAEFGYILHRKRSEHSAVDIYGFQYPLWIHVIFVRCPSDSDGSYRSHARHSLVIRVYDLSVFRTHHRICGVNFDRSIVDCAMCDTKTSSHRSTDNHVYLQRSRDVCQAQPQSEVARRP